MIWGCISAHEGCTSGKAPSMLPYTWTSFSREDFTYFSKDNNKVHTAPVTCRLHSRKGVELACLESGSFWKPFNNHETKNRTQTRRHGDDKNRTTFLSQRSSGWSHPLSDVYRVLFKEKGMLHFFRCVAAIKHKTFKQNYLK